MNTNFNGVWDIDYEASQRLVEANKADGIINIASVLGFWYAVYYTSKGAVIQLTSSLAMDLMKYNIRVNAIVPGWFKTEINDDYFNAPAGKTYLQQMPARRLGKV
ncbi:MAG: NAD(P)-dependent dehydrogenase (short-subunit alcohol dehydrogenase family) [Bermanella sp.]|jgi:NAD(P)-dependent dehydrogenase (short-subunit alcohol dehydrogenase family)